jgi:hypothetical protein
MRQEGIVKKKEGRRLARPARRGECVTTVVDGEVANVRLAVDDESMVVRHDTIDHELFLMTKEEFSRNYNAEPCGAISDEDISEHGYTLHALRREGFKYYTRKGAVVLLPIQKDDADFCPNGFKVNFSSEPQTCEEGNYFAMPHPRMSSVYVCYHAEAIYGIGEASHPMPNQKQMFEKLMPIMLRGGITKPRLGERMARPAQKGEEVTTVVKSTEVSKRMATDNDHMIVLHQHEQDTEAILMSKEEFEKMYIASSTPIQETRYIRRGYRMYKRKGQTLLYKLTKEDIDSIIPYGFWTHWSEKPQTAVAGDYLASPMPFDRENPDMYICRHARSIYGLDDSEPENITEIETTTADEPIDIRGDASTERIFLSMLCKSVLSMLLLIISTAVMAMACHPAWETTHRYELFGTAVAILALSGWVSERFRDICGIVLALTPIVSSIGFTHSSALFMTADAPAWLISWVSLKNFIWLQPHHP